MNIISPDPITPAQLHIIKPWWIFTRFVLCGFSQGDSQFDSIFLLGIFSGRSPIEIIELLGPPIIPCFAVSDEHGRFVIGLNPAQPARKVESDV